MSKLSKTAKAAVQAGQNKDGKKDWFDTNEKKIAELRKQRNPAFPLAVNRYDFIDALLEEYDKVLAGSQIVQETARKLNEDNGSLRERIVQLESEVNTAAITLGSLQNTSSTRIAELEGRVAELETVAKNALDAYDAMMAGQREIVPVIEPMIPAAPPAVTGAQGQPDQGIVP